MTMEIFKNSDFCESIIEINAELKNLQINLFFNNLERTKKKYYKKSNFKPHEIKKTKKLIAQLLLKKSFLLSKLKNKKSWQKNNELE